MTSYSRYSRYSRAAVLLSVLAIVAIIGCAKNHAFTAPTTFCSSSAASLTTCTNIQACDTSIANQCATLDKAISQSVLDAAHDCLDSAVCGPANCLSVGRTNAKPSAVQTTLATTYCASCAPDVADCEAQFYAKKSKLPGSLVLAYADVVVQAVSDACTTDPTTCRSTFAQCATDTITQAVAGAVDPSVLDCLTTAVSTDQSDATPQLPDGGPQITTCTAANCKGCCRDDKCEVGTTLTGCGANANACQTCHGAQKCTDGRCKEPCSPNNCAGCCNGDTCVPGTLTGTCGSAGAACTDCTRSAGDSFICSNNKCVDSSCQATCTTGCCTDKGCQPGTAANACGTGGEGCFDCGVGRLCNAATASCLIDPNSTWDFYVSFAILPDNKKNGSSWDAFSGAPDPYLTAYSSQGASSHTGTTTTQTDTTSPFWAETPLTQIKASELQANLSFEIWDSDLEFDDYVGGCAIPLGSAAFDGSLQSRVCPPTASTDEITLYFRVNPHP